MARMGESIYDLIPPVMQVREKDPMYQSKFPKDLVPTASTFGMHNTSKPGVKNVGGALADYDGPHPARKPHATFGKPDYRPDPTNILRKTKSELPEPKAFEYPLPVERRPSLPKAEELPKKPLHPPPKNFVQANAVENILSQPKKPPPPVDWKKKPSFGKIPQYLVNIKKEIQDEYEYMRAMAEAQASAAPEGMRLMGNEEKDALILDLKKKWDAVNAEYQKTSTLSLASLDTIGKIKRKEQYEAQLAQIEKDIEKLSKPVIWIHKDD
eukprot:CAMPEP_0206033506 /NCGR_PEP_ID=MMETSP1466-20131121/694_1 /ASSEMBLY_ACC=CAM_ASM_001126 /TAXON_ID=44452 /ORGANISM="Pavlova gyrans, Strain CCMP608" /LENGTH=267 /DNA_ID=CAMNT_0053407707 /DNA_START=48 /DNA_END=851 /DNA_ORIENTATION=+